MGEYAKRKSDGVRVKIGTCEEMYYIRYEDRFKVEKVPNSLDPATELNLFWRLPFPDEDHMQIGEYDPYERGERLWSNDDRDAEGLGINGANAGIIQMHHPSGVLVNLKCYHGYKLPEIDHPDISLHWNGKSYCFELCQVKNTKEGIRPVVWCRFCREKWSFDWADVVPYVHGELADRLLKYQAPT